MKDCPDCHGMGWNTCVRCEGSGKMSASDEMWEKMWDINWYELLNYENRKTMNDFKEIIDCMEVEAA